MSDSSTIPWNFLSASVEYEKFQAAIEYIEYRELSNKPLAGRDKLELEHSFKALKNAIDSLSNNKNRSILRSAINEELVRKRDAIRERYGIIPEDTGAKQMAELSKTPDGPSLLAAVALLNRGLVHKVVKQHLALRKPTHDKPDGYGDWLQIFTFGDANNMHVDNDFTSTGLLPAFMKYRTEGSANFSTYAHKALENQSFREQPHRINIIRLPGDANYANAAFEIGEGMLENIAVFEGEHDKALQHEVLHDKISHALSFLTERQQKIVQLKDYTDEPVQSSAMALEMGISTNRINELRRKALSKLRDNKTLQEWVHPNELPEDTLIIEERPYHSILPAHQFVIDITLKDGMAAPNERKNIVNQFHEYLESIDGINHVGKWNDPSPVDIKYQIFTLKDKKPGLYAKIYCSDKEIYERLAEFSPILTHFAEPSHIAR